MAGSNNFFSQLKGVPVEYLISTPLLSAARSNMALGQVMVEFINEIGFDQGKTNLVKFDLTRMYQNPVSKQWEKEAIEVQAPLLGLVPIPALLIQSVNIDLTVNISTTMDATDTTSAGATVKVDDNWGFGSVSATGTFSTSSTHKRSTNQTAEYQVRVQALQQQLPEGMSKLMDVMASVITPIPSGGSQS